MEKITLTAKEKKLFPIHDPLSHVEIELSMASGTIDDLRKVLDESCQSIPPEVEHWHTAFEAMAERARREIEQVRTMLHAARKIAEREKAGVSHG
jgi:hypothetical protein